MTVTKILDYVYPMTKDIRCCGFKKKAWLDCRNKLAEMIDQYRSGAIVDFQPLKVSIDLEPLLKQLKN